jgi:hypothetical protein
MAVTAHSYTKLADSLATKKITLPGDTIKCLLLSAYTVGTTQDTAQFVTDVLAAGTEASGTGYTTGGVTLTSVTWTASGHVFALKGTIPAWTTTGGSLAAAFALFYDATPGTNATNPVLCYWDLGSTQTSSNGTFTLTQNASGILTVTGA